MCRECGSHRRTGIVASRFCVGRHRLRLMERAIFVGLSSGNKEFIASRFTEGRGKLAGVRIDSNGNETRRDWKWFCGNAVRDSTLHELGPDGKSRSSTFQFQVMIVVKAHPHKAKQTRCESCKPS